MSSRKRGRDPEDEDVQIRVAAGEPVAAESAVLRALSSCARRALDRTLPVHAAEWDVSGLLLDGKPYSRDTVSCWVQCCNSHNYGTNLDSDSINQLSTVTGLTQVLAFADAVGSFDGMLRTACSHLQQLKLVVQLPEEGFELPMVHYSYGFDQQQLLQFNLQGAVQVGAPMASAEQRGEVVQQVAQQLSLLLQMAHVLHLQALLDVLHSFILRNVLPGTSYLLTGSTGLVFTDAVLDAALGSSTLSKEAYVSSVMSQPCSLAPGDMRHNSLLKRAGPPTFHDATKCVSFDAQLLRDFAGGRAGDTVMVELDLFGTDIPSEQGVMKLQLPAEGSTTMTLPAQLLLGRSIADAAGLDEYLKVTPPA